MDVQRVLVVYKRSLYEKLRGRLPRARLATIRKSHQDNLRCLERVEEVLRSLGITYDIRHRSDLQKTRKVDLVVSVGGDGTFLSAASQILDTPILGVNSSPSFSVGFFCGAQRTNFARVFRSVLSGDAEVTRLARMRVRLNGKILADRVLNDVLVTADHPAMTSRYIMRIGRKREQQRSSGVWICTPAGSTAATRAAGGKVLPLRSRKLQYVVREPYLPPERHYALRRGILPPGHKLVIESKMDSGVMFIDGPRLKHKFILGDRAEFEMRGRDLSVVALDHERRKRWR